MKLKVIFPLPWAPKNQPGDIKVNEAIDVIRNMCKRFENEEDGVIVPCGSVHYDDSNVIENMIMKLSIVPIIRHVKDDRVGMGNFLKSREEDVLALNLTSTKS